MFGDVIFWKNGNLRLTKVINNGLGDKVYNPTQEVETAFLLF
jgi:hypothetical protein